MKINITKEQLKLISIMIWSPDNLKCGFTKQITPRTLRELSKGNLKQQKQESGLQK